MSQGPVIKVVLTTHQIADACCEYADKRGLAPKGDYRVTMVVSTTASGEPCVTLELEPR